MIARPASIAAVEVASDLPLISAERVLFERMFRNLPGTAITYRRPEGSGAGLVVVQCPVEARGGTVPVQVERDD